MGTEQSTYNSHIDVLLHKYYVHHCHTVAILDRLFIIWFRPITYTPQLNDKNRHSNKETKCLYCEEHSILEDIKHFSTTLPNSEYNKER